MKLKLPRFNQLKIQLFGLLSFLLWASSDRNQTSWKFHLQFQKLKMGHRFGQYDFIILFGILTSRSEFQYINLVSSHHQLTDLLVSGQKFLLICQICVQKISYLKMGQTFKNTTFRFVKLSAVGFLRPKSNFQHFIRIIWDL